MHCWDGRTLFCFLILATAVHTQAEESSQQIAELIPQLGDESFSVREQATQQLQQIGLPARQALLDGLKQEDPEIRRRCQRILVSVLQADYRQRLEQFRSSDSGGFGLEGWDRYEQLVGSDAKARELFVKMHEAESGLLASAEVGGQEASNALKLRFSQAYRLLSTRIGGQRREPSVGSMASLIFVRIDPELDFQNQVPLNYWASLLQQQGIAQEITQGDFKVPLQRLLEVWCELPEPSDQDYQKMYLALRLQLKAGISVAKRVLANPKLAPTYRATAVEVIARLGGKSSAILLTKTLDDNTEIRRSGNRITRLNDVALAWLVQLTGQKIHDYSQPDAQKWFDTLKRYKDRFVGTNYSYFGYTDEKIRKQAYEKWGAWVKENPLPAQDQTDQQ